MSRERYPVTKRIAGMYECAGWIIQRQTDTCGPEGIGYRWLREHPNNGEHWHETKREAVQAAREYPAELPPLKTKTKTSEKTSEIR